MCRLTQCVEVILVNLLTKMSGEKLISTELSFVDNYFILPVDRSYFVKHEYFEILNSVHKAGLTKP